jgi:hypothetical protein
VVAASPEATHRAFVGLTTKDLFIGGPLFALRTLPSKLRGKSPATPLRGDGPVWESMIDYGFVSLEPADRGVAALGFIGRPWRLRLSEAVRRDVPAEGFVGFTEPNYVKGLTGIGVRPHPEGSLLVTETRVFATDPIAERRFRPYWALVHPFSSLMRREMLSAINRRVRASDQ